jgi:hypothetical protein
MPRHPAAKKQKMGLPRGEQQSTVEANYFPLLSGSTITHPLITSKSPSRPETEPQIPLRQRQDKKTRERQ